MGKPKLAKAGTEPAEMPRGNGCMPLTGSSHLSCCSGIASHNSCITSDASVVALAGHASQVPIDGRCRQLLSESGTGDSRSGCSWVAWDCMWDSAAAARNGGETIQVPTDGCLRYVLGAGPFAPTVICSCTQGALPSGAAISPFLGSGNSCSWGGHDEAARVGGETIQVPTDGCLR